MEQNLDVLRFLELPTAPVEFPVTFPASDTSNAVIAAAREIRGNYDFPVIFLTAYADEETRQRAQAAAPAGFLSKLADDRDLHEAIQTRLAGRFL